MKRDIIKADIEWDEDANDPYINLDVKIDDEDFVRNIYIEDIKLYNQNTFANPTNPNDGISIFNIPVVDGKPRKEVFYNKINIFDGIEPPTHITTGFFELDNPSVYAQGHYFQYGEGEWYSTEGWSDISSGTYSLKDIYYFSDEEYRKVDVEYINNCINNNIDVTKIDYFEKTEHVIRYYYENLQDDPLFKQNFDINNDIIIISVKIHPNPDDKCQSDYILKAIYNKRLLLLESMAGVREIADTCTIPRRFIDFILRQKAIDLAQENNDIDLLCKYFKMFSGSIGTNKIEFAPCGCLRG